MSSTHGQIPGLGRLAYIADDRLTILDGDTGTSRTLTVPGHPTAPVWSPDGRWLAFLTTAGPDADLGGSDSVLGPATGRVWVVGATAARPALVFDGPAGQLAWSPTGTHLGFITSPATAAPQRLLTWQPGASPVALADLGDTAATFAWSPDGRQLAMTGAQRHADGPSTSTLWTERADGSSRTVRLAVADAGLALAGWWPDGRGWVFWQDPQLSASIAADGMDLFTLALSSTKPRRMATSLGYRSSLAFGKGFDVVAVVTGGGRSSMTNRHLRLCVLTDATCSDPPGGPGDPGSTGALVVADPTSQPTDNYGFAYVVAADRGDSDGFAAADYRAWYATRQLWEWGYTGGNPHQVVEAGTGIAAPTWSASASYLLYVKNSSLWLLDTATDGAPREVSGPLFTSVPPPNYYGSIDWRSHFAWAG